jgi:pimeloyl-ACP methyl ester carboxylesterase
MASAERTAVLLPGILMPAAVRYGPLVEALGPGVRALPKDLEVYATDAPPPGYGVTTELDGLTAFLDARGIERVHLYGHSAGASIALAYAAARPERVLSLALDEPATDYSAEDRALLRETTGRLSDVPPAERMAAFARSLVRPGVEPPAPPPPPPGPESAKRPAGLLAWEEAMYAHEVTEEQLARFPGPVYVSYGSLSSQRWEAMASRLSTRLARCRVERYEGLHHLRTSHQAEPARVAQALSELWS